MRLPVPHEKTAVVLFVAIALLGAVRHRWAVAGAAAALATLTWQPAFVIAVSVSVVALMTPSARWRNLPRVLIGALVPVAAISLYYLANGSLRLLGEGLLGISLRSATTAFPRFPDRFITIANVVAQQELFSILVFSLGLLGMLGIAVWRLVPFERTKHSSRFDRDSLLVVVVAFILSVAWTIYDFQGVGDLFLLFPFSAVGAGALFHALTWDRPGRLRWIAISTALNTRQGLLVEQQRSVDEMLDRLPAGGSMISIGAPQAMVLSGSTNPNPYLGPFPATTLHLVATWPGGMRGFLREMNAAPPEIIAFRQPSSFTDPANEGARLQNWIDANYVEVGQAPGWRWLVHHDRTEIIDQVDG